jgi:hypothetical protein
LISDVLSRTQLESRNNQGIVSIAHSCNLAHPPPNPKSEIESGRLEKVGELVKAFEHQIAPGRFQLPPASKSTRDSASHGTGGLARVYINRAIPYHDGLMRSGTA